MLGGFFIGLVFGAALVIGFEAVHYFLSFRKDKAADIEFYWRRNKTDVARPGSAEHFHRVFGHKERS